MKTEYDKRKPNGFYFSVSFKLTETKRFKALPPTAQVLFFQLCRLRHLLAAPATGIFGRSDTQLRRDTGLSEAALKRARHALASGGWIEIVALGKPGTSTRYRIKDAHRPADLPSKQSISKYLTTGYQTEPLF